MPFEMVAGDTKRLNITLVDGQQSPLDITDATIRWQASRGNAERFSTTPSIMKSIGSGITVEDEQSGIVTIALDPADTIFLSGEYYHELEIVDATGDVATALSDTFTVRRGLIG